MGSPGKHRPDTPLIRNILILSGALVAITMAGTWALASTGSPGDATSAVAQVAPPVSRPTSAPPTSPAAPRATPAPTRTPTALQPKTAKPKPKKTSSYRVLSSGSCQASFYGEGQMTASGERFNPSELTAAHKTLAFGTRVRVTNRANGESVIVRINDRGPFVSGRCLDLSTAAMRAVGGTGSGVISVKYQVLKKS